MGGMKFVIAAGGTGGHLFPGLAVGEVLLEKGHEVLVLISEKEIDSLASEGRKEFRFERVPGVGLQGRSPAALLRFASAFRAGYRQVSALFGQFPPDAVLGMGGFTSTAPILAGRTRRRPTFIHESNAIPGKANRLNARMASRVLLGFADCARFFPEGKCEVTGTPVRRSLGKRIGRAEALAAFGLSTQKRTLLVMGGSQGAHGINMAVAAALPVLRAAGLQVIHLAGRQDEEPMRQRYREAGVEAFVAPFWREMEIAYSAADLAVARSGAASLSELSCFSLPSVLIPYPAAAEDHQTLNARIFARAGAAVVLPEREAGEGLGRQICAILEEPGRLAAIGDGAGRLAPAGAAERVAETLLKACV